MSRLFPVLVLALIISCSTLPAQATQEQDDTLACLRGNAHLLYQSNWHMMEDIFITQPELKTSKWFGLGGLTGLLAVSGGAGTYFGINKGINYLNERPQNTPVVHPFPYPFLESKKNILAAGGAIVTTFLLHNSLKSLFLEIEEMKQLERLLTQWPDVKEQCPKELHASFNKLIGLKTDTDYPNQLRETVRLAKTLIRAHFPDHYKGNQKFFDQSRLNFNLNVDMVRIAEKILHFFA